METNLFFQGIRPAVSVGLSVSRVGGSAQTKAVKSVAKSLRVDLAQFRELASFSQFSTDLDADTKQRIERGQRLTELLKQPQYTPYATWQMYVMLLAATSGAFDKVEVAKIKNAEAALLREFKNKNEALLKDIDAGNEPDDKAKEAILKLAEHVAESYKPIDKENTPAPKLQQETKAEKEDK